MTPGGIGIYIRNELHTRDRKIQQLRVAVIMIILYLVVQILTGCAGYTYNGIRGEDLKKPTLGIVAGFVSSYVVHMAGHLATAEIMGYDWHIDGTSEIIEGHMSDRDARLFAMAGFASQLAIGYGMRWCGVRNDFSRGYNTATLFEIATYPINPFLRGGGDDLDFLDSHGGNSAIAYGLSTAAAINLINE